MGLLDKLFGGSKEDPQKPPASKFKSAQESLNSPERAPLRRGRLPSEPAFQVRQSEAFEAPRAISLKQVRFGKTVERADGPVLRGVEHRITGASLGIDTSKVSPFASMRFLSGHRDVAPLEASEQYPWKAEDGVLISKTEIIDGKSYKVFVLDGFKSEDGKGVKGRLYSEMQMVLIPTEEYSLAILPQLKDILKLQAHIQGESRVLPQIEVSTGLLDEKLPDDWFNDSVKELIRHLIEGQPFSIQNWNMTKRDFLNTLFYALLCVPERVSHSVSFGAGMGAMKGDVRIGHGMRAQTKTRQIAGQWKSDFPDAESTKLADLYIARLVLLIQQGMTARQMIQAVQKIPAELQERVEKNILG